MSEIRDEEYYQEAVDLNEEQEKAWKSLVRAIAKCKKANIYFYQVLESLHGLNGNHVETIRLEDRGCLESLSGDHPSCLQMKELPCVITTDGFADDNHFIELKADYEPEGGLSDE